VRSAVSAPSSSSSSSAAALLRKLGPPPKGCKYHAFLTHAWANDEFGRDNHKTLILIYNALMKHGVLCWFDDVKMEGQIVDKMTQGIDQSFLVLVFITKSYLEKVGGNNKNDNCKIEFG
jgi:TIR domain